MEVSVFAKFLFSLFAAATLGLTLVGSSGTATAVMLPAAQQPVAAAVQSPVSEDMRLIDQPVTIAVPIGYTLAQTSQLNIDLDTGQLFEGAQLIIDALSSPYLLIAGLGLGVAILAAILKAVQTIRL